VQAELDSRGTTVEQRRTRYDEWRAQRARDIATRPTPTPWQHLRRSTAPAMVVVFGVLGWVLAGVFRPTFTRAAVGWLAAWLLSQIAGGHIVDMLDLPHSQPAWWVAPAIISTLALVLFATSQRRRA
jgi:TRAP-type mannitol/chloroaromatic compound transport system permease large subunit